MVRPPEEQEVAGVSPSSDGAHARTGQPPTSSKRQQVAQKLGADLARQLGWRDADYTEAELMALGEQLILDHALHGDDAAAAQLLVAVARSAGALEQASASHDETADQVAAFLNAEFEEEFAILQAASELAAVSMPSRPALARDLLRRIGLDPDRRVDTPELIDPENMLATNERKKAAEYYFNKDRLSTGDIRNMCDHALSDTAVRARLHALPASLDTEFSRRFDAYTQAASDKTVKLLQDWLSWLDRTHGADLKTARMEIATSSLQYYRREVEVLRSSAFTYDGPTLQQVPAGGYFVTLHTAPHPHSYFLSIVDGGTYSIPVGTSTSDWALRHPRIVFDASPADADPCTSGFGSMRRRVALAPMGQGQGAELGTWLPAALRPHFDQGREAARGQTPADQSVDILLDFIPFRRMIVSIRAGDINGAMLSGGIDVLTFAIPMLCSALRLAAGAARGLASLARSVGRGVATGIGEMRSAIAPAGGLRAGIKSALASLNATTDTARALRPLDLDAMALRLRQQYPWMADALNRVAARARGPRMRDGWWQVKDRVPVAADNAELTVLEQVSARSRDGLHTLPVLPYGGSNGRAYTRVDPITGNRVGPVLLADNEGWLYPTLPVDTLARYRVGAADILSELGARQARANGTLQLNGKTYARIADEYIEITLDHAATAGRPAWRVIAPRGARRDVVTHRLLYDNEKALWRCAEVPRLRGGDTRDPARGSSSARTAASEMASTRRPASAPPTPADISSPSSAAERAGSQPPAPGQAAPTPTRKRPMADGTPLADDEPVPKRPAAQAPRAADSGSPALPAIGPSPLQLAAYRQLLLGRIEGTPSETQIGAVRELLAGLETHPRGRAILSAMQANHEMRGEAPKIVLLDGRDPARPRPSLSRPVRGAVWHLDPAALNTSPPDAAVRQLAAVYNNMTGILQNMDPFATLPDSGAPALHPEQEAAWTRWVGRDARPAETAEGPSKRQAAVDTLRRQLLQAKFHGGLSPAMLRNVLAGKGGPDIPGLQVELYGLELTDIPPLPGDLHGLHISGNPITDWSNLPADLKVLTAADTGGSRVLNHLPPELISLDVSNNSLETIPGKLLPRKLKRLSANDNKLTEVPAFLPDSLEQLVLSDNDITSIPGNLPRPLTLLDISGNNVEVFPGNLPEGLEDLDLSANCLTEIPADRVPPRLVVLDIGENNDLDTLPILPETLRVLFLDSTGLRELPEDLPRGLQELHATDLQLTQLPANLPPGLLTLGLADNELTDLPPGISSLTACDVYLEGNPIVRENLPPRQAGRSRPIFHFSMGAHGGEVDHSRTLADAIWRWLGGQHDEALQRWDAIGRALEDAPRDNGTAVQFRRFMDILRTTVSYQNVDFRASVREWLVELSKPERKPLLQRTLQACTSATERCDDRVALTLNDLRKLRAHDDIRIGRYDGQPADVVEVIRQTFRLDQLRDIAYRKIKVLTEVDDVEVYLAYVVKLREPLGLSTVVPDMRFFHISSLTQADLDAALGQVRAAERTSFYRELVLDDTWQAYIKPKLGACYDEAERTLHELSDGPLSARVRKQLEQLGLDPDDLDAQQNIGKTTWREMQYEVLEPLTRDYLTSEGVPLPAVATDAMGS